MEEGRVLGKNITLSGKPVFGGKIKIYNFFVSSQLPSCKAPVPPPLLLVSIWGQGKNHGSVSIVNQEVLPSFC